MFQIEYLIQYYHLMVFRQIIHLENVADDLFKVTYFMPFPVYYEYFKMCVIPKWYGWI